MSQINRINGGLDRPLQALNFSFNGRRCRAMPAIRWRRRLLANGQRLVGRSFKYHRPRGIFSAGSEEPNAMVAIAQRRSAGAEHKGHRCRAFRRAGCTSQNHRGSLEFDLMAANDLLSPFLSAGFYYKTFMWPKAFWEKAVRTYYPVLGGPWEALDAARSGHLRPRVPALRCLDHRRRSGGPQRRAGRRTRRCSGILADEDFLMGGRLNAETHEVAGMAGRDWAVEAVAELAAMDNVRLHDPHNGLRCLRSRDLWRA